jgi:hypothetical protein
VGPPQLADRLAENAFVHVRQWFSWDAIRNRLIVAAWAEALEPLILLD